MNFKRLFFHLSNFVLIFFLLLLILFLNSFLTVRFDFLQNSNVFIIFLSLLGSILFLIFSKKILKSLLTSDESLKNSIKNTLHELNIPTSTIKINTQLLKKSISDEKTLQRVERIEKANESLFELYKNMEYEFQKVLENIDKEEFYLLESINKTLDKFEDIKKDTKIDLNLKDISLY
ncbi:histidine kinase, partial [Aliarcobacter skirrowii]